LLMLCIWYMTENQLVRNLLFNNLYKHFFEMPGITDFQIQTKIIFGHCI